MVHNIHENGWADGTTLSTGARGWLPTNFCSTYEVEEMQLLLKASIAVFEECRLASTAAFVTASQTVVADVVNGVRHLLEATDCLTRDSVNVQADDTIRKSRKILLSELSVLVKTARRLPDELDGDLLTSTAQDLIDDMILSSFRVVVRGSKFLDSWCDIHDPFSEEPADDEVTATGEPVEGEEPTEVNRLSAGNRDSTQTSLTTALDLPAKERPQRLTIITPSYQPDGQTSFLALTPASTVKEAESDNEVVEAIPEPQIELVLASARLNSTYDSLLSCLATYIGTIHLKAPLPSRLFELTKDAVEVGKALLEVVDLIQERDQSNDSIESPKENFKDQMNILVTEAQRLVKPLLENEDEIPLAGSESQPLIDAATKCVQGATQCFDAAHGVLENIEDFEITLDSKPTDVSHIGIGITTTIPTAPVVDGMSTPTSQSETSSPVVTKLNLDKSLPLLPAITSPISAEPVIITTTVPSPPPKNDSFKDVKEKHRSIDSTAGTSVSMQREDSQQSATSDEEKISTRATTPIHDESETPLASPKPPMDTETISIPQALTSQSDSVPQSPVEGGMIAKTHAHNLILKDGLVCVGSLPALVEQMTMPDSKPDITFVNTFFTTFRCWSSPSEIASALINRFDEVDGNLLGSTPVRVRVYNVFKQWLETHWKKETDSDVLPVIRDFAINKLRPVLPTPGERLQELTDKVLHVASDTSLVPREPATLQKTRSAVALNQAPEPRITRTQYNTLRNFQANGGEVPSVLDFDPLEIARQLTIIDQKIFCQIAPHELLGKEWSKKHESRAVNVLAMTKLSTQMALWIAFTILNDPDPKKRAAVIKHWIKIADKLFEMANFNTMMAIICALNNSTIVRLKKTWELVSPKTKAALEKLRSVVDPSRNYVELRTRTRNQQTPCLPFLGTYLTDMVFFDDGNADKKPLPNEDPKAPTGINFNKYTLITKMLQEIQHFQVPYPMQEVPEFQHWIDYQMRTLRESGFGDVQKLYRQSLAIEPKKRDPPPSAPTLTISTDSNTLSASTPTVATPIGISEKGGLLGWTQILKEKSSIASFNLAMSNP
ncbi:hypothetical protein ABW20_dc0108280 [Dactylellina cionopaga]|nr:hypothetical protein ABW20_dc0108280 [Dactylellina cionopaga]